MSTKAKHGAAVLIALLIVLYAAIFVAALLVPRDEPGRSPSLTTTEGP